MPELRIDIDPHAGFCFGVTKVVDMAEEILRREGHLYCLGSIVHNIKEIERLQNMGLKIITYDEFLKLSDSKVLVRAHGEPPETYRHAQENNIEIIDGTCPIVLKLQSRIQSDYDRNYSAGAQIVIYGKKDHAEVRGLSGQTGYNSIIIESEKDLNRIDYSKPVHLYAQTTMNGANYSSIINRIREKFSENGMETGMAVCTKSICGQVSGRIPRLKEFCSSHDVIIFASSPESSNGKLLFQQCRITNEHSYFVAGVQDVRNEWIRGAASVGITGATSTPRWLLEQISDYVKKEPLTI
jgi:4-hydroxy-3-methylbut-2-en-1-yl diphosphate reductase